MFLALLLAFLLFIGALVAVYGLRRECSSNARLLIVLTPIADGLLTYFLLIWFEYSSMLSFVGGLMFGFLSLFGIQACILEAIARFSTGMAATQSKKASSCVAHGRFDDRIGDCIILAYCW